MVGELHDEIGRFRAERELLLWLHAEAVWQRDEHETTMREFAAGGISRLAGYLSAQLEATRLECARLRSGLESERSSRQAWAEEAMRLDHRLEEVRADRQRRIDSAGEFRTHVATALGFEDQDDPDEYAGDDAVLAQLRAVLPDGGEQPSGDYPREQEWYPRECEFCTREAALACTDATCRARKLGEGYEPGAVLPYGEEQ